MIITRRQAIISGAAALAEYKALGQRATFYNQNVNSGTPLNPCLVSAWAMNEGSGLTLNDSAPGGTNTITISSGSDIVWTANSIKTGVTSPVWQGVGIGTATSTTVNNFDGTTPFSVFLWSAGSTNANQTIIGNNNTASNGQGWALYNQHAALGGQILLVYIANNVGSGNVISIQSSGVTGGYIGFTYDGSGTVAGLKLYGNGVALTSTINTAGPLTASAASGLPVAIGGSPDGSSLLTSVATGYVAIYNCALTPTQIANYYARGPQLN